MTQEEIFLARKQYNMSLKKREELLELRDEISNLTNEDLIKECKDIFKRIESLSKKYENKNILLDSFYKFSSKTKQSNRIYAYMGAYQISEDSFDKLVDFNDADYVLYEDIETGRTYMETPWQIELFEDYNEVIKMDLKGKTLHDYKAAFVKLRERFFELLLKMDQDQAVKQLILENKKLQIEDKGLNLITYKETEDGVKATGHIGYDSLVRHRYIELYNNLLNKTERYIASKFGPNYFDLKTNRIIYTVGSKEKTILNEEDMQSVLQDTEIIKNRYSMSDIDDILVLALKNKGKVKKIVKE